MISKEEWKQIAPKPDDQARCARLLREAGLPLDPSCGFLNGVPQFTEVVSDEKIRAVLGGDAPKRSHHKKK